MMQTLVNNRSLFIYNRKRSTKSSGDLEHMNIMENLIRIYLKLPRRPMAAKGKINIACVGDSLTRGAGVRGKRELTWEYYLNENWARIITS